MGKIVNSTFVSLDGVINHMERWHYAMTKYVASTTLQSADWKNTTILNGDLIEAVTKLKQDPGQDILMHGYGPVAKSLVRHGLLDELVLWVHPVLAGIGTAGDLVLSEDLTAKLRLLSARPLTSGVVVLSYQLR